MGIRETAIQIEKLLHATLNRPEYCEDCNAYCVSGVYKSERTARKVGRKIGDHHLSNLIPYQSDPSEKIKWLCRGCQIKRQIKDVR